MKDIDLIISIITFFIVFLLSYMFSMNKVNNILKNKKSKKSKKKEIKIFGVTYLVLKFNLKKERLLTKKMILIISLLEAFIISTVFFVISFLPLNPIWQMLIGFMLLFGFIYSIFGIFGSILLKRGYDKDEL